MSANNALSPSMDELHVGASLPLCSAYLMQLFHSPLFLTASGHAPVASQQRILHLLNDPALDSDDRIDAVRNQLDACLRLNSTASANRKGLLANARTSPDNDIHIPDAQLDDIVLELMHRHQQETARRSSGGAPSTSNSGGKPRPSLDAYRPPRPSALPNSSNALRTAGNSSEYTNRTLSVAPGGPGRRVLPSSGMVASPNQVALGISSMVLSPGADHEFGLSQTTSASSPGAIGDQQTAFIQKAVGRHSPFVSPGASPRMWGQGLPLPMGDSVGSNLYSPWSRDLDFNSAGSAAPYPPFTKAQESGSGLTAAAPGLQRTSSDIGGEPTSPRQSLSRGSIGSEHGNMAPGPPGPIAPTQTATSNAQPFAKLATTNAAVKVAAANAAAAAASGGSNSLEFRPRWGSTSPSGGQHTSDQSTGRRQSDTDDAGAVPGRISISVEGTDEGQSGPTSAQSAPSHDGVPAPSESDAGDAEAGTSASADRPEHDGATRTESSDSASMPTPSKSNTPAAGHMTLSGAPPSNRASSISSAASSAISPRLNVAAVEFKPRLGGSSSSTTSLSSSPGVLGMSPGTPPRFGGSTGVPLPGAEAGGAAWYGYALATAAASSSTSPPHSQSSPNMGAYNGSSSASLGSALLGTSPGANPGGGFGGGTGSPPISPTPGHAYPRSVKPTPLRKQVGTDDDEEEEPVEEADGIQYASYAVEGSHVLYGVASGSYSSSNSGASHHGRKSHEHEEDDDDDEFSPFATSKNVSRGGGGARSSSYYGGSGVASSLVSRMMAGSNSPAMRSHPYSPAGAGSPSGSFGVAYGHDYGAGAGSDLGHPRAAGPPAHTPTRDRSAGHLQYLQSQMPAHASVNDVFTAGYGEDSYGASVDGSGSVGGIGSGVSDAEFSELEAAIEAEEADRKRANMTPFDILYSFLNGDGAGDRKLGGPKKWSPKQIEMALSRNGWDVEATLSWIVAGGMNTLQGQSNTATSEEGGKRASAEAPTPAGGSGSGVGGAAQGGPLSSSLSSSASSSLSSSAGTHSVSGLSSISASTSATSATPRGGASGAKSSSGPGQDATSGPSTSLPHFVHHYIPGSTKPPGFASPRATFSVGSLNNGNGSSMARSGSGSSNAWSGNAAGSSGSVSGGTGNGQGSGPISYRNGVAVLPHEAFQSHKGGASATASSSGHAPSGLLSGSSRGETRSPKVNAQPPFHLPGISNTGPLTPSQFQSSGSSPLPSPGLNGPTTPGGSGGPGSTSRVCRYFLAGECRRFDCRFSHDLGRALCRFWLRGQCLNDPCGFLHDYDVVNKLARGMKGSLTASAGNTPNETTASGGGGDYFAQRPGGGDGIDSPGDGGLRWGSGQGKEPSWVGRTGSFNRERGGHNQDGYGSGGGGGSGPGTPSRMRTASGRNNVPTVPDADAPDEFPVLGRSTAREEGKKSGGSSGGGAARGPSGPRWVLASSGAGSGFSSDSPDSKR
ncbi:hypothetical protein OC845_006484 [Tilletia horrida]|nr:hypothetical protein OC845_006484 [Tilletia horrida]